MAASFRRSRGPPPRDLQIDEAGHRVARLDVEARVAAVVRGALIDERRVGRVRSVANGQPAGPDLRAVTGVARAVDHLGVHLTPRRRRAAARDRCVGAASHVGVAAVGGASVAVIAALRRTRLACATAARVRRRATVPGATLFAAGVSLTLASRVAWQQLECLHRYLDGNGRLGRLLVGPLLWHRRLRTRRPRYLSLFLEKHRQEYYGLRFICGDTALPKRRGPSKERSLIAPVSVVVSCRDISTFSYTIKQYDTTSRRGPVSGRPGFFVRSPTFVRVEPTILSSTVVVPV